MSVRNPEYAYFVKLLVAAIEMLMPMTVLLTCLTWHITLHSTTLQLLCG